MHCANTMLLCKKMRSFLVIQTAFTGDVILATALIEQLKNSLPDATIDVLVRKGNETLLENNPSIRNVLIWDKRKDKFKNLFRMLGRIRNEKYTDVVNLQRFASSGILTAFSGAKSKSGFDKNPFSVFFTHKIAHEIGNGKHEIERNSELIHYVSQGKAMRPVLYPSASDYSAVTKFQTQPYICIAPGSVWFTKTLPEAKWIDFIRHRLKNSPTQNIFLLGSPAEFALCESIINAAGSNRVFNMAGKLSFLESAALMKNSKMNYVNDSAPMHIASAMNAPVTAVYCSTIPAFGFGPLSDESYLVETNEKLPCRPCGLHGFKSCPEKHFRCALSISVEQMEKPHHV